MKYPNFITSFFFLAFLINIANPFYFSKKEEINQRILTINTLTKVHDYFYMVNYENDYYFEDLLKQGSKDYNDLLYYVTSRFGTLYDFNILSSPSFSCSCFNVFNSENQNLMGRNFDNPYSPSFIIWTQPKNKYKSVSFVLGYYLGMRNNEDLVKSRLLLLPYDPLDGLNEHGFAISVLVAQQSYSNHQTNPNKLDLSTTLMIRGALDNCKTTEEAIEFFDKYNMHDINEGISYHFFLTDNSGDSAVIEYVNGEMKVIRNKENNYGGYLYVTNFYLSKEIGSGNNMGYDRYQILESKLKSGNITMEWDEAMNLLNSVHMTSTVWSNVYNTQDLTLFTSYHQEYSKIFKFSVLNPMNYTTVAE